MTERTPIETRNLDIYGNAPLPWTRPRDQFAAGIFFSRPAFLGTVRPDGRPHAAAVATLWLDGDIISPAGRVRANPAIWPRILPASPSPFLRLPCARR